VLQQECLLRNRQVCQRSLPLSRLAFLQGSLQFVRVVNQPHNQQASPREDRQKAHQMHQPHTFLQST
jgi:hypothetical protein